MLVGLDSCLDPAKVLYDQIHHTLDTFLEKLTRI